MHVEREGWKMYGTLKELAITVVMGDWSDCLRCSSGYLGLSELAQ